MKVRVWLSADKLPPAPGKKLFGKGKVNAFAVVSEIFDVGSIMGIRRNRVQTTDVVPQTSSPEWATTTVIEHAPGTEHRLSVDIFHSASGKVNSKQSKEHEARFQGNSHRGIPNHPQDAEQLCSIFFDVETVLSRKDFVIVEPIPGTRGGKVTVRAEVQPETSSAPALRFQLRGYGLVDIRRGMMEKPDYHFEIRRKHFGKTLDTWVVVYRSASDEGNLNPTWDMDDICMHKLCQDDLDGPLQITIFDVDKVGHWSTLGSVETTVRSMMESQCNFGNLERDKGFALSQNGKTNRGELIVVNADVITSSEELTVATPVSASSGSFGAFTSSPRTSYSMRSSPPPMVAEPVAATATVVPDTSTPVMPLPPPIQTRRMSDPTEYLRSFISLTRNGRCNVDLCVAIDFTATNGDFHQPGTAHFRTSSKWNNYEWIMSAVGESISEYSHTQEYPIWGFGGEYNGTTYQLFQCGTSKKANGIQGLLEAYAVTFQTNVTLGKQRSFKKVIEAAAHHAKTTARSQSTSELSYTVLLVLTPGNDSDVLAAKESIVNVEGAPLSILFVRVPVQGQPLLFDDEKLQVYLSNRNCQRPFTTCFDGREVVKSRDQTKIKQMVLQALTKQLPAYFEQQGVQ